MKKDYTVEDLKKLGKPELQKIAKGLSITFQENDTKEMLAKAIVAEEARLKKEAEEASGSGSGSASGSGVDKAAEEKVAEEKAAEEKAAEEKAAEEKAAEEKAAEEKADEEKVVYTLPEACKRVIDLNGNHIPREEAIKDQELLAKLKEAGHRGVKIK